MSVLLRLNVRLRLRSAKSDLDNEGQLSWCSLEKHDRTDSSCKSRSVQAEAGAETEAHRSSTRVLK